MALLQDDADLHRREHNMIRFHNGIPTGIYFSQHIDGVGYEWDDVTVAKTGDRVCYNVMFNKTSTDTHF